MAYSSDLLVLFVALAPLDDGAQAFRERELGFETEQFLGVYGAAQPMADEDVFLRMELWFKLGTTQLAQLLHQFTDGSRLAAADVPADLLTIELTEGSVMAYPGLALRILQNLRDIGVRLSVDDYGTGYSSLTYLKDLPVTELKIDKEFITGLTSDPGRAIIVQNATDLGHALGLTVVAEGVEDETTLTALNDINIDVAQGFHIGRPMPEKRLHHWITERTSNAPKMVP